MSERTVREITAEETRPLRHQLLRSHQTFERTRYRGDDAENSLHVGAFENGQLVGIVSIINEPPPDEDDPNAWRLRGMAVLPEARRKGHGERLVQALEDHVSSQGGSYIWFNARTVAVPFYRSVGYQTEGEEYDMGDLGPHYFMRKELSE